MNEIQHRRELKRVLGYGIPKHLAKYIVDTAMEEVSTEFVSVYIDIAIDYIYYLGISVKQQAE